ncbi:hypothetical protein [Insolitispirillum peregrinum]|uniref:Uncharacterized protein n=1 Tax=Insolitispirillum peregrinum TaxID=80876 RepID=A0A1N7NRD2_9PROT|nr:hypothetical protein [Insolitispirillum peregrinum]SIT00808.1 hypothetical protein SAMN05421779_105314 [Insolitispirillum peregrinum]
MTENPTFTPMLAKIEVSNVRRVSHSLTNWFQSIDRGSFSASNVTNQTLGAFGNASGSLGLVAGAATLAGSAIASGAFLAACAGPQVAVTAGVAGIVMFAKSAYSNREQAHQTLSQYVWNLVDDQRPPKSLSTTQDLEKAADAALTLLNDGQNQLKLLPKKLQAASTRIDEFHEFLRKAVADTNRLITEQNALSRSPVAAQRKGGEIKKKSEEILKRFDTAMKPGGELFEYVRRLSHTGNYVQAPLVLAHSIKVSAEGNSPQAASVMDVDYFATSPLAQSRNVLMTYHKVYADFLTLLSSL